MNVAVRTTRPATAASSVRRLATVALSVAALTAAACLPRTRPAPDATVDESWVYTCADNYQFGARVMNEVVSVRLPLRTIAIPRAGGPSGARYASDGMELTRRGEGATLRVDGETRSDCTGQRASTPWDVARLLGADFRAIGLEPAWSLEIEEGRQMRFLIEGSSEIHAPAPQAVRSGTSTTYRAVSEGHRIDVTIEARPCPVAALDQALTHTVTLAVDGFPYAGCGRMLGSAPGG